MKKTSIRIIGSEKEDISDKDIIYVSFSKTIHDLAIQKARESIYFFDIPHGINLQKEIPGLEKALLSESKKYPLKKWFPLVQKFIYRYLISYNQFYNRLNSIILNNKQIEKIEISSSAIFVLKSAVENIANIYKIKIIYNNSNFLGFSDCSSHLATDIPKQDQLDNHNLFLYLIGFINRLFGRNTFMLPSSLNAKIPQNISILKISYLTIFHRLIRSFKLKLNSNYIVNIPSIDFSKKANMYQKLDPTIWGSYRNDQIQLIQDVINVFFEEYNSNYFETLQKKLIILFKSNKTKKIIIDETNDALRRIIMIVCHDLKIDIDFLPHGLVAEDQHTSILNLLSDPVALKVLAWNKSSSKYFNKRGTSSESIKYPVAINRQAKSNLFKEKKDLLIMLSGGRITLNGFEDSITSLIKILENSNLTIDWKYHQLINKEQINVMKKQKKLMENYYDTTINTIHHSTTSSSILNNYKKIIFTTWTTGIFEAALLDIPFIIYTKDIDVFDIHAFDGIKMPIASNRNEFLTLLNSNDNTYLSKISRTLTENISLEDYLCCQK